MTSIDREIEKVTHDLRLAKQMGVSRKGFNIDTEALNKRLDALYGEKARLQQEEDAALSRFEAEHKPRARSPDWWDKLGMEPAGDTTLEDGEWAETKL